MSGCSRAARADHLRKRLHDATLTGLGIEKTQSHRWQRIASSRSRHVTLIAAQALKLKPLLAERSEQGRRTDLSQNSVKSEPLDTQKELAKVAGVSHDTIGKDLAAKKPVGRPAGKSGKNCHLKTEEVVAIGRMLAEKKLQKSVDRISIGGIGYEHG